MGRLSVEGRIWPHSQAQKAGGHAGIRGACLFEVVLPSHSRPCGVMLLHMTLKVMVVLVSAVDQRLIACLVSLLSPCIELSDHTAHVGCFPTGGVHLSKGQTLLVTTCCLHLLLSHALILKKI